MLSYEKRNSVIHCLDPRVKMLWLVLLLAFLFSSRTVLTAVSSVFFTLILFYLSSMDLIGFYNRTKGVILVLVVPFILGAVFVSPVYGFINSLILFSAISMSALFILTTDQKNIIAALCFFRIPRQPAFSLSMSLYFLPVLERKFTSVRFSQAARSYSSKNPIPFVIPFLHSVFRRARNLSISIDARAFDPDKAVIPGVLKMKALDWSALVILIIHLMYRIYTLI